MGRNEINETRNNTWGKTKTKWKTFTKSMKYITTNKTNSKKHKKHLKWLKQQRLTKGKIDKPNVINEK